MLLKLNNISKSFEEKVAVHNLSMDIQAGLIYGIIGPNGAGKTTTIRMVMNITIPDSGEVLYKDKKIDESFKNIVGYLPEERGLYKKLTLAETIRYMGMLKNKSSKEISSKIDYWLKRVDLIEYKDKKVEELSKGMAQKLQFITTVIHDPEIIILDELFSGLDPLNMEVIKSIILEMKRSGKTILFSTHVMEQAEKLCDNICMIAGGEKVLDGKLADIKEDFGRNSIHLEFEGDGSFINEISGIKSVIDFNNYKELVLEKERDTNSILKQIADKVTVKKFDIVDPSLYDIFIEKAKQASLSAPATAKEIG